MITIWTRMNLVILAILFILFLVLMLTEYLTSVVILLAASLLLSYLLLGPVRFVELLFLKSRMRIGAPLRRTLSIALVYLLFFVMIGVSLLRLIPPLITQLSDFAQEMPTHVSTLDLQIRSSQVGKDSHVLMNFLRSSWLQTKQKSENITRRATPFQPEKVSSVVQQPATFIDATSMMTLQHVAEMFKEYASRIGNYLLDVGTMTITGVVYALTSLVIVFYLLHDGKRLKEGFVDLMPVRSEAGVSRFLDRWHLQFYNFVKGQVVASFVAGAFMYVLLELFGIRYAFMLAVGFGLVSILPVIGPWIGLVPICIFTGFSEHPLSILQVLIFSAVFYLLKSYWLWPKLVERRYDIHPVVFILTFLICLKVVSYFGILLSFPLASILSVALGTVKEKNQVIKPV